MNIIDYKCLPVIAEEGVLIRDLSSGNVYRRDGTAWTYVDADALAALDAPVAEIEPAPASIPADDPNAAAITSPAAGSTDSGAAAAATGAAGSSPAPEGTGTDANGSPVDSDPPPADDPPPAPEQKAEEPPKQAPVLSEGDIEKLTKARRKEAQKQLKKDEEKSK